MFSVVNSKDSFLKRKEKKATAAFSLNSRRSVFMLIT